MVASFETFPFGGAKTKRLGFCLADFLGCPISHLFLDAKRVPKYTFSLWHFLHS